jgi:hypothetical protein
MENEMNDWNEICAFVEHVDTQWRRDLSYKELGFVLSKRFALSDSTAQRYAYKAREQLGL